MRGFIHFLLIVQMALLVVLPSVPSRLQAKTSAIELPTEAASTSNLTTGLPFIENVGQFPDAVRFQAGNLWLAEDSLWLTVMEPQPATEVSNTQASLTPSDTASITSPQQGVNLKLSFVGANPQPQIEAFGRQETYINYFRGNDSAQWRSHVPTWAGVRYKEIYSGVDLEVSSIGGQWRWRLVSSGDVQVASQSLSAVQLRVEGGNDMTLLDDTVHVSTTIGVVNLPLIVVDEAMVVAQAQHASMISLDTVNQPFTTVPTVPVYTAAEDSLLRWATYLGGSTYARVNALALTTNDEVVVAGFTFSSDFPVTPGAFDTSIGGGDDGIVARLSADGSTLRWATYLGGSTYARVNALALTTNDEVVVAGITGSSDFPVTSGAFDTSFGDGDFHEAAFVARLIADGSTLRWATFLGGSSSDRVYALALTTNNEVVVAGFTRSSDFPVTPGAFDTSIGGGDDGDFHEAAFAARLRMESRVEPTPDPPPNGYSISGRLVGEEGNPIAAAVVNYGSKFVTSNLSGNYTITGLITGTYTLTPTSVLNHFEPLARTITVPPNATDQNFIGISIRPLPVVLVHGWNDTAASWETYLDDFLPSIGRKGWAVDSMYTGWGVGIPLSIDENAKKLANYIAYVKSETGAKQVDIVVHSMGGLISRRYIAAYMDKNAPDVNQLIMLGTPNGGTKTAVVNQLAFYLGTKFNPSSTEITPWSVEQFNADNFDRRGVPFYAVAGNYRCDTKFPKSNLIEGPDPDDVAVWRLSVFAIALEGRWTYPSAQVSGCGGDHRGMRSSAENDGGQQIFNLFVSPLLRGQMPATPSESVAFLSNQTDISQAALAQAENNALQFSGVQSGTLEAGGRSEFSQLLESTASAGFTVVAPPDQVVVSLRDPNGQVIASSTTDANVQFMQMDPEFMSITSYVITNPTPGIWTTIVEANTKTPDEGVVIASIGSLSSDLQLILPVAENAAGINRPVQIAARLQSGATPVLGASVNAQLVSPDGLVTLIALADDGLHGDGSMGDGLYGYQFIPMTPGVYSALISAEGVNGDTHFERSTVWAIQVDGNQVFLPLTLR